MTASNIEKRSYARVPLVNSFLFRLEGNEYCGNTSDISPGGLRLVDVQPRLPSNFLGQQGNLFFDHSRNKAGIKCEIRHIDDSGIGVRFCTK